MLGGCSENVVCSIQPQVRSLRRKLGKPVHAPGPVAPSLPWPWLAVTPEIMASHLPSASLGPVLSWAPVIPHCLPLIILIPLLQRHTWDLERPGNSHKLMGRKTKSQSRTPSAWFQSRFPQHRLTTCLYPGSTSCPFSMSKGWETLSLSFKCQQAPGSGPVHRPQTSFLQLFSRSCFYRDYIHLCRLSAQRRFLYLPLHPLERELLYSSQGRS